MRRLSLCSALAAGATLACSHPAVQTGATPSTAKTAASASPSDKANSSPLYVVDGVAFDALPTNGNGEPPRGPTLAVRGNPGEPLYVTDGVVFDALPAKGIEQPLGPTPTVRSNAEPLYVIDGVILDATPASGIGQPVGPTPTVRPNAEPLYIIDGVFIDAPPAKNP